MTEIVVAVYPTGQAAEDAVRDLVAAGVPSDSIRRHRRDDAVPGARGANPHHDRFWSWLGGRDAPEHDALDRAAYERALAAGGTVVGVFVEDAHAARIAGLMRARRPEQVEERPAGDDAGRGDVRQFRLDDDTGRVW